MAAGTKYEKKEKVDLPEDMYFYSEYGTATRFNRVWGGHRFTDDEVARLCAGEEITFEHTYPDGGTQMITGALENQTFSPADDPDRTIPFVGFVKAKKPVDLSVYAVGVWAETGKEVKFKRKWGTHEFTEAEIAELLAGRMIGFEATRKDSDDTYEVNGRLAEQTFTADDGRDVTYIGFEWDRD